MATAPKNYTTSIPVQRTVGEVMECLAQHGADQVMLRYDANRQPAGISFSIATADGRVGYHLPVNVDAVFARLEEAWIERTRSHIAQPNRAQAARMAWRTIQDWLEAQLELIANGLVQLDEVMLPFRLVDGKGTTVYQALKAGRLALPSPEGRRP